MERSEKSQHYPNNETQPSPETQEEAFLAGAGERFREKREVNENLSALAPEELEKLAKELLDFWESEKSNGDEAYRKYAEGKRTEVSVMIGSMDAQETKPYIEALAAFLRELGVIVTTE